MFIVIAKQLDGHVDLSLDNKAIHGLVRMISLRNKHRSQYLTCSRSLTWLYTRLEMLELTKIYTMPHLPPFQLKPVRHSLQAFGKPWQTPQRMCLHLSRKLQHVSGTPCRKSAPYQMEASSSPRLGLVTQREYRKLQNRGSIKECKQ